MVVIIKIFLYATARSGCGCSRGRGVGEGSGEMPARRPRGETRPRRASPSTCSVRFGPIWSGLVRFGLVWLSVRAPIGRSCGGQEKRTASRDRTCACSAGVPPSADGLSPARMAKMRSSTMRCTQQRTGAATGQKWSSTDRRCEESRQRLEGTRGGQDAPGRSHECRSTNPLPRRAPTLSADAEARGRFRQGAARALSEAELSACGTRREENSRNPP